MSVSSMLEIEGLTVRYPNTIRPAVHSLDLEVRDGEFLTVVGESGSGKSTLALACLRLLGEDVTVTGSIRLSGRDVLTLPRGQLRAIRGREVGFVYQDALSSFSPLWTVGEQISETIRAHERGSKKEVWGRVIDELARVRVRDPERVARSYPHELSGGQRQRAALAMSLVLRPRLLIADEPTSALDVTTAMHLLALLKQLQAELAISVLLITHDMRVVEAVADRIAVMYAGVIGEVGGRADVLASPRFPYTKALLDSLDLGRGRGTLAGVPGTPPGLSETIAGCVFRPRCSRALAPCELAVPPVTQIGASSVRCYNPYVDSEGKADADSHR